MQELYVDINKDIDNKDINDEGMIRIMSKFPKCCIHYDHSWNDKKIYGIKLTDDKTIDLGKRHINLFKPEYVPELNEAKSLIIGDRELTSLDNLEKFNLPNLESLTMAGGGIRSIANDQMALLKAFSKLNKLGILDLVNNQIESLEGFPTLDKLRKLSLRQNQIESLKGFPNLNELRELDLSCNKLTSESLDDLPYLPKLRELYLDENGDINDEDLIRLASKFPYTNIRLGGKNIHNCIGLMQTEVDLGERHISLLNQEHIPSLKLAGILNINDHELKSLDELKKFNLPELKRLSKVSSLNAEAVEGWPNLEELKITRSELTDVDASCLADLKNLETLSFSNNGGLTKLTGLTSLTNLKSLNLSGTNIAPENLHDLYEELSGLSKLEDLKLFNNKIDAKLLGQKLAHLEKLQKLWINGCKNLDGESISKEEIVLLSRALPNCYILLDPYVNYQRPYRNGELLDGMP